MADINSSTAERKGQRNSLARNYLNDRRVWIAVAIVAVVGGLALNWNWLVAAGLAPLVLLLLSCAVMCALPFCMKRSGDGNSQKAAELDQSDQPPRPIADGRGNEER